MFFAIVPPAGLALVLAFVDDQIRLGLVFGDMDFHVRLAFVLT